MQKAVFEALKKGDKIAKEVFKFTGQILGRLSQILLCFSSPEAIILLGGVIKAGKSKTGPCEKNMEKTCSRSFKIKMKLLFSELKGI